MKAVEWNNGKVRLIDQTKLPHKEEWVEITTVLEMAAAIKEMKVRGAPAIGVAAAYGMALSKNPEHDSGLIKSSRPTAVDLSHAVDFVIAMTKNGMSAMDAAQKWEKMNGEKCNMICEHGAGLIGQNQRVLTHCNTGFLATNEHGSALGAIKRAHEHKKNIFVYVDETRPRIQGALTSWELLKAGVNHKVICDNSAGFLMQKKEIDIVMVGADRIAANGDTANKIGTYSLSVLAKEHGVPFYVLAPVSSFDFGIKSGNEINIEEREETEVLGLNGKRLYPKESHAVNLAFDITPAKNITGFVTESGIFKNPDEMNKTWKNMQG